LEATCCFFLLNGKENKINTGLICRYGGLKTGDDWEHEETFTDDDEAVGNDPEEREEQVPEGPAPPEIKQVCAPFCNRALMVLLTK
jgi:hypothetical protein